MEKLQIKPNEKVEAIRLFLKEMIKFDKKHPGFIKNVDYFIKSLPAYGLVTPFHRREETDEEILSLVKKYGKGLLKKLYLADWEFVKVISYQHFFIEHLYIVDEEYNTIYNILDDSILFTNFLIPSSLKHFDCQASLYLKKKTNSI